jgi:hypothetical protein
LTYELVHGLFSGGSWTFTPVTSAGTPLENSIALDSSGFPHIAFYEQSGKRLLHATSAAGAWATDVVDQGAGLDLGRYNSIAINPSTGRIHVAYYDATHQDLRYARKDSGRAWVLRLIDLTGDVGSYTGIGVDTAGNAHITYYDATNHQLKVTSGSP